MSRSSVYSGGLFAEDRVFLTVKVNRFSNEDIHRPGKKAHTIFLHENLHDDALDDGHLNFIDVYANGMSNGDKGCVSILLDFARSSVIWSVCTAYAISCVVSVLDKNGNRRFSQSFVISQLTIQEEEKVCFDKFVKRKILLDDQDDLLYEDTLTLYVYINILDPIDPEFSTLCSDGKQLFKTTVCNVKENYERKVKLRFSSALMRHLCRVSNYFRCVLDIQMIEKDAGYVEISYKEALAFKCIFIAIKGYGAQRLSLREVCMFYQVADKYGIECALDECRKFIKNILSVENINEISNIAELYQDTYLQEAIENFRGKNDESKFERVIDSFCEKCKQHCARMFLDERQYVFSSDIINDEPTDFDFYK